MTVLKYVSQLLASYEVISPPDLQSFYDDIVLRNEFIELSDEDFNKQEVGLYNHQLLMTRLLNILTGLRHQLVFYDMGLGKSVIYISIIEEWRRSAESQVFSPPPALILVRSEKLASHLRADIIRIHQTLFKTADFMAPETARNTFGAAIRKRYNIQTFFKYARHLSSLGGADLQEEVNSMKNAIVVCDEVQHVRNMEHIQIYDIIHDFFRKIHTTSNIYLFTGTPMVDDAAEFINIMNLILPNEQLLDATVLNNERTLSQRIMGYVSYLKFKHPDITLNTQSPKINYKNSGLYVEPVYMSKFQSYAYYRALQRDGVKSGRMYLDIDTQIPLNVQKSVGEVSLVAWSNAPVNMKDLTYVSQQIQAQTHYTVKILVDLSELRATDLNEYDIVFLQNQAFTADHYAILKKSNDAQFSYIVIKRGDVYVKEIPAEYMDDFYADQMYDIIKYQTEFDRFAHSLDEDMAVSEDLDDAQSEFIPESQTLNEMSSIYTSSSQASLFVYPDGSYGRDGELRYMSMKNTVARTMDDWILMSKQYPADCTIYTKILTEWDDRIRRGGDDWAVAPMTIHATIMNSNITFLMRVLTSSVVNMPRYDAHTPDQPPSFYMVRVSRSDDVVAEMKKVSTLLKLRRIAVLFLLCSDEILNDGMYLIQPYSNLIKLGANATANPSSLFDAHFKSENNQQLLKKVGECSVKYKEMLMTVLSVKRRDKIYIYSELIAGSGIKVFMRLLELAGYTDVATDLYRVKFGNVNDLMASMRPARRFAFVSSAIQNTLMNTILEVYNHPKNVNGDYIQVFMGTETVSEGISLKDTVQMYDVSANWNLSSIEQAEHRIYRLNAFQNLRRHRPKTPIELNIHRLVAVPHKLTVPASKVGQYQLENWLGDIHDNQYSLDDFMYSVCIDKDRRIKRVEFVCKISAVDCSFNMARNTVSGAADFSRDCEYKPCKYKCVGRGDSEANIKMDTYNLHYSKFVCDDIRDRITHLLTTQHLSTGLLITDLLNDDLISEYDDFLVFKTLYDIIGKALPNKKPPLVVLYDNGLIYTTLHTTVSNSAWDYIYTTGSHIARRRPKHTIENIKSAVQDEYTISMASNIAARLKTPVADIETAREAVYQFIKSAEFELMIEQNTAQLVCKSLKSPHNLYSKVVCNEIYSRFIIPIQGVPNAWIFTASSPFMVCHDDAPPTYVKDVPRLQDAVEKTLLVKITNDLKKATANTKHMIDSVKNVDFGGIQCIYGTIQHYDDPKGRFHLHIFISNEPCDAMLKNLGANLHSYVGGHKDTYPMLGGIYHGTLDINISQMITAEHKSTLQTQKKHLLTAVCDETHNDNAFQFLKQFNLIV